MGSGLGDRLATAARLAQAGRMGEAIEVYRTLARREPRNAVVLRALGAALLTTGEPDEALQVLQRAVRSAPKDAEAWRLLAVAHKQRLDFAQAHAALDRAQSLSDSDPHLAATRMDLLLAEGRFAEAHSVAVPALLRWPAHVALVLGAVRLCPSVEPVSWGLSAVDAALRADIDPASRARLLFARARLLDLAGRYDEAFDDAERANTLWAARFDAGVHDDLIDRMIARWEPNSIERAPRGRSEESPVFIVGMPRSGTTLVEQILAAHPEVRACGERADITRAVADLVGIRGDVMPVVDDPSLLTQRWLERTARAYTERVPADGRRLTDKMPLNFAHLGVIARVFPRARVLHCLRDPRDTCLSCFMQVFEGSLPFAYSLRHLGRFYRAYARLMRHWCRVLDIPITTIAYESIVQDQRSATEEILRGAGLAWHEGCVEFHTVRRGVLTSSAEQVRRPVYSDSVGRWRHYAHRLGPLLEALGDECGPGDP